MTGFDPPLVFSLLALKKVSLLAACDLKRGIHSPFEEQEGLLFASKVEKINCHNQDDPNDSTACILLLILITRIASQVFFAVRHP